MSINYAPSTIETTTHEARGMTMHDINLMRMPKVTPGPESMPTQQTSSPERSAANIDNQVADNLDVLEDMRRQQTMKLIELRSASGVVDGGALRDTLDTQVDEFLQTRFGLTPDTPGYDDLRKVSREASIDNHPSLTWYTGGRNASTGTREQSGREQVRRSVSELFTSVATAAAAPEQATPIEPENKIEQALIAARETPEFKKAMEALDDLREKLAVLTAKEIGKPATLGIKYDRAREEYNEALRRVGQLEEQVRNGVNLNRSDTQKNIDLVQYIMAEQTKLRDMTRELFTQTKVSKFIEWFNTSGHMTRLARGVADTFVGQYVHEYARSDQDRGIPSADERISVEDLKQYLAYEGTTLENATTYSDAIFDSDKKLEQNKRRKAAIRAFGTAAVGSTVTNWLLKSR